MVNKKIYSPLQEVDTVKHLINTKLYPWPEVSIEYGLRT